MSISDRFPKNLIQNNISVLPIIFDYSLSVMKRILELKYICRAQLARKVTLNGIITIARISFHSIYHFIVKSLFKFVFIISISTYLLFLYTHSQTATRKRFDRKTMDADDAVETAGAPNNRFSKSLPSENIVFT